MRNKLHSFFAITLAAASALSIQIGSAQTIHEIGGDKILHTTQVAGKCRDWRAVYYPTFEAIKQVLSGNEHPQVKAQKVSELEALLPTRIQLADTLIRSTFTRPHPETDIAMLPTGDNYGAHQWFSLYDAMPGLRQRSVQVSRFWDVLWDTKEKDFLENIRRKHNGFYPWTMVYDTDTVLEIGSPNDPAGKRILLFQSDLDIDADGSDGERMADPKSYSKDDQFQPEASYRWKTNPRVQNPFFDKWDTKRQQHEATARLIESQIAKWNSLKGKYGHQIDEDIEALETQLNKERYAANYAAGRVREIQTNRHYVGELDPFIVCPHEWTLPEHKDSAFAPSVGDYAFVFYGKKIYPCIFADQGPNMKTGEASLALAKVIRQDNPRLMERKIEASFSPFYDLEVTYMVFPGTAKPKETFGLPDYNVWNRECAQIINGLGGLAAGFTMHRW